MFTSSPQPPWRSRDPRAESREPRPLNVIVARIQSHPSRRQIRQRLVDGLAGIPTEIVETETDPPSPWYGYRECLKSVAGTDCTHALLVQDDAIVCDNIGPALERIASITDVPVCLFLPMVSVTRRNALFAAKDGKCFVEVVARGFLPVVAVLWPKDKAMHFLEWSETAPQLVRRNGIRIEHRSDDAMGYLWQKSQRQKALATIPSLVQHPDDVPSTIARKPGGRTALFWHEPPWDPMSVDWRL